MTPAETAAVRYGKAEAKFLERATFYDLMGAEVMALGSRIFADRCHRAVVAEMTNPKPPPLPRLSRR